MIGNGLKWFAAEICLFAKGGKRLEFLLGNIDLEVG